MMRRPMRIWWPGDHTWGDWYRRHAPDLYALWCWHEKAFSRHDPSIWFEAVAGVTYVTRRAGAAAAGRPQAAQNPAQSTFLKGPGSNF